MSNILNWFTGRKVVIFSLIGAIVFFVSVFVDISVPVDVCYKGEFCGDISQILAKFSFLFISILFFSLLTLKLKKSFISWKKFTFTYLPIYLFIIFLFPRGRDPLLPITEELVALFLTCVYSIISILLILYKSLQKE